MLLRNTNLLKTNVLQLISGIPSQSFAIRTTQATVLKKVVSLPQFSRQSLKALNEREANEKRKKEIELAEARERLLGNKFNDKNPVNHVKVKVNALQHLLTSAQTAVSTVPGIQSTLSRPYIVLPQPRPPKIIAEGVRRKIPCSMKKLLLLTKVIRGKHLFDAIALSQGWITKAARYLTYTLQQVRRHAIERGLDEERLYVHAMILGKLRRTKKIRYHAKGKSGVMKSDSLQLRIKLEEKPVEEIYKNVIQGKISPAFAYLMRKNLLNNDADYETIRKYQYILTAKGRQQRKLMFKRAVLKKYLEYKANGVFLTKNVIAEQLLNEEADKLADAYKERKMASVKLALKDRQDLFKKNEENTA